MLERTDRERREDRMSLAQKVAYAARRKPPVIGQHVSCHHPARINIQRAQAYRMLAGTGPHVN